MKRELLLKARRLNWILTKTTNCSSQYYLLCYILSDLIDANVYIFGNDIELLGGYNKVLMQGIKEIEKKNKIHELYNEAIETSNRYEIKIRSEWEKKLLAAYKIDFKNGDSYRCIIPIIGDLNKVGDLCLSFQSKAFSDEDLALAEFCATVVGYKMQIIINKKKLEKKNMIEAAKVAIGSLSHTEICALRVVFQNFCGTENIIIVSKVADRSRMGRTVFLNALRKIQSAGIIECQSLGMKGTYVRVVNVSLLDILL